MLSSWDTLSNHVAFRDIEKFLKGYGYIRNISVKVAPPTSLEHFWHHPGTFTMSNRWHLQSVKISGTFTVSNLWQLHSVKTLAPTHLQHLGRIRVCRVWRSSRRRRCCQGFYQTSIRTCHICFRIQECVTCKRRNVKISNENRMKCFTLKI